MRALQYTLTRMHMLIVERIFRLLYAFKFKHMHASHPLFRRNWTAEISETFKVI